MGSSPLLLGTPTGTIGLKQGDLAPARREHFITKQTSGSPAAGGPSRWIAFLSEACAGDENLVHFIQVWLGYCLTGSVKEHALVFVIGPGGNGKSVLLNTVQAILADYVAVTPMETLTAAKYDRHPTEVAALCGTRMVQSSETEAECYWAETRLKQLTGGDPISARFMRQDLFSFLPTFKFMIAGNHAPKLQRVDEEIARRLKVIEFHTSPRVPDKDLEAKLCLEHGQILTWMIEGALNWQRSGPALARQHHHRDPRVSSGSRHSGWLAGPTLRHRSCPTVEMPVAELFQAFSKYLDAEDEPAFSRTSLGADMRKRGFPPNPARIGGKIQNIYRAIRWRYGGDHRV